MEVKQEVETEMNIEVKTMVNQVPEVTALKKPVKRKYTDEQRKLKQKAVDKGKQRKRIYLGKQYERWKYFQLEHKLASAAEVAKFLLDSYAETHPQQRLSLQQRNWITTVSDSKQQNSVTFTTIPQHQNGVTISTDGQQEMDVTTACTTSVGQQKGITNIRDNESTLYGQGCSYEQANSRITTEPVDALMPEIRDSMSTNNSVSNNSKVIDDNDKEMVSGDDGDSKNDFSLADQWKKQKQKTRKTVQPWVNIILDDHPEKYTMETFASFEQKNRKHDVIETLYCCLVCNQYKIANKDTFTKHIEAHVNDILKCPKCNFEAVSNFVLTEHKRNCMEAEMATKNICDICGFISITMDSYWNHMGEKHNHKHWECKVCPDKFTTQIVRKCHMIDSHGDELQYCSVCKKFKTALSRDDYHKHLSSCTKAAQCPECGVMLCSKWMVTVHINKSHRNLRLYNCDMCPYTAKTKSTLRKHVLAHKGIHPYKCEQCDFSCVQKTGLRNHMRTHTGEKPYRCDQGSYASAWNVQLKEHMKAHGASTSVTCNVCGIVFKNDNCLRSHSKKSHCNVTDMTSKKGLPTTLTNI